MAGVGANNSVKFFDVDYGRFLSSRFILSLVKVFGLKRTIFILKIRELAFAQWKKRLLIPI
jgi:hypothetical protein